MLPGSKLSKANAGECLGRAVTLGSRSDAICSPLSSAFDREPSADSYLCPPSQSGLRRTAEP